MTRAIRGRTAFRLGHAAEERAASLLVAKGYDISARRFRSPVGEIDIVARRGTLVVFCEVKARARLTAAAESLTVRQRRRLLAAAEAWLADHPDDATGDIRFDVVLIAPGARPRHLMGAFDASE